MQVGVGEDCTHARGHVPGQLLSSVDSVVDDAADLVDVIIIGASAVDDPSQDGELVLGLDGLGVCLDLDDLGCVLMFGVVDHQHVGLVIVNQ